MNDEEKKIDIRDQFAAAMSALIVNQKNLYENYINNIGGSLKPRDFNEEINDTKMKRLAIIAYRIADHMRKARLVTFE